MTIENTYNDNIVLIIQKILEKIPINYIIIKNLKIKLWNFIYDKIKKIILCLARFVINILRREC